MKKTIITAATTGAWPKKKDNPNVPMTPSEIADDVFQCWKEGAAIAHLHMRDDSGNGSMDAGKFRETVELLREIKAQADKYGVGINTHLSQSSGENRQCMMRNGCRRRCVPMTAAL